MNESEIINRGMQDYLNRPQDYRNPYGTGTPDYNAYERGWMQALKRDDRKPAPWSSPPPMPPVRSSVSQPEVNLYAELKGRSGPRK